MFLVQRFDTSYLRTEESLALLNSYFFSVSVTFFTNFPIISYIEIIRRCVSSWSLLGMSSAGQDVHIIW